MISILQADLEEQKHIKSQLSRTSYYCYVMDVNGPFNPSLHMNITEIYSPNWTQTWVLGLSPTPWIIPWQALITTPTHNTSHALPTTYTDNTWQILPPTHTPNTLQVLPPTYTHDIWQTLPPTQDTLHALPHTGNLWQLSRSCAAK